VILRRLLPLLMTAVIFCAASAQADPNKNIKHDLDASGFGLSLENKIERDKVVQPSTCKMQRPS